MKFKIVCDSSCNLTKDYINDPECGFEVVPLTIRIDDKEYVDNEQLDVNELLEITNASKTAGQTSCPAPSEYYNAYQGADYVFAMTISSKLSGSYNSARIAKETMADPSRVCLIDSLSTAGSMEIMVDKLYEWIKEGKSFEEISKLIVEYQQTMNILFVLDRFDNLVKNGRMNKIVARIAELIAIKPLCMGEDGEIKIKEKIRTFRGVLKRLVFNIGKMCPDQTGRKCVICHTLNDEAANYLKKEIEETYNFAEVKITKNRGLCAFYSLNGGVIVSF